MDAWQEEYAGDGILSEKGMRGMSKILEVELRDRKNCARSYFITIDKKW